MSCVNGHVETDHVVLNVQVNDITLYNIVEMIYAGELGVPEDWNFSNNHISSIAENALLDDEWWADAKEAVTEAYVAALKRSAPRMYQMAQALGEV